MTLTQIAPANLNANTYPTMVEADLLAAVEAGMANHPRTLQTAIGPSEIGVECDRALIHKLAMHEEPPSVHAWKARVGTFAHAGLQQDLEVDNAKLDHPRWLLENRVHVGDINSQPVYGNCDVFDTWTETVGDWKTVGPTRLRTYKANGPGQQYRVQAHLYGRGWQQAGWNPSHVMIVFLPRNGTLRERHVWSEPYDETVAVEALARATGRAQLIATFGVDAALAMYQPCTDDYCDWCAVPKQPAASTSELFNPTKKGTNP